jgi:hypothetical protein
MGKGTRCIIMAAAAVASSALTGGTSTAADHAPLTVVLHVNNLAGTEGAELVRAQAETQRIFDDTGVRLVWADVAEGPAAAACERVSLSVSLLPPHLVQEAVSERGNGNLLGSAVQAAGFAVIYSDRIGALAERKLMDESVLLGRVIAHEVGHLLLPGSGHSWDSIMTARIDTDPRPARARFTARESSAIRAWVESEMGKAEAGATCGS